MMAYGFIKAILVKIDSSCQFFALSLVESVKAALLSFVIGGAKVRDDSTVKTLQDHSTNSYKKNTGLKCVLLLSRVRENEQFWLLVIFQHRILLLRKIIDCVISEGQRNILHSLVDLNNILLLLYNLFLYPYMAIPACCCLQGKETNNSVMFGLKCQ